MKKYIKPSLEIESVVADTLLSDEVVPLYNEEVEISAPGNLWGGYGE